LAAVYLSANLYPCPFGS